MPSALELVTVLRRNGTLPTPPPTGQPIMLPSHPSPTTILARTSASTFVSFTRVVTVIHQMPLARTHTTSTVSTESTLTSPMTSDVHVRPTMLPLTPPAVPPEPTVKPSVVWTALTTMV